MEQYTPDMASETVTEILNTNFFNEKKHVLKCNTSSTSPS